MKWSVKFLRVENNIMILWFVVVIGVTVRVGGGAGWNVSHIFLYPSVLFKAEGLLMVSKGDWTRSKWE